MEILLDELFVLGKQETNEEIIKQYANRRNIITQQEYLLTISSCS